MTMIARGEASGSRVSMEEGASFDDDASSSHPSSPYISPRLAPKPRQGAISASDDDNSLPPLSAAVPMRRGAVSGASMGPLLPLPPMKLPPEDAPSRGPSPANGKRPSFSVGHASLLNEKRPSITLGSLDGKRHSISSMGAVPVHHHDNTAANVDNRRGAVVSGPSPYMTHPAYTSGQQASIRLSDDGHGYYHAAPASPRSMASPAWSSHTASAPTGPAPSSSSWGAGGHHHPRHDDPRAASAEMQYSASPQQHHQDSAWAGATQQQSPSSNHGAYASAPPLPATATDAPYRGPSHRAPSAGSPSNPSWSGFSDHPHEHHHHHQHQHQHHRDLSIPISEGYQQSHNPHHRQNRSVSPMHQEGQGYGQQHQQHEHQQHQSHGEAPDYGGFAPMAGGKRPRSAPRVLSTQPRIFACSECPARFARNHDLKRHQRGHLSVRPFPCDYCGKSFSRKDALKRHVAVKGCGKEKRGDDDDKRGKRKYGRGSDEGSRHLQRSKLEDAHDQDGSDDDQDDDGGNNSEDYGSQRGGAAGGAWDGMEREGRRMSTSKMAIDNALGIIGSSGGGGGGEAGAWKPSRDEASSSFSHLKRSTSIGDNQLDLQVTTTAHHPVQRSYGLYDPRLASHHSILRDTSHALGASAPTQHRPSFSLAN